MNAPKAAVMTGSEILETNIRENAHLPPMTTAMLWADVMQERLESSEMALREILEHRDLGVIKSIASAALKEQK